MLGIINMSVMVTGSIFLGEMIEPISSTKNPYSKMDMGMPYAKRPKSLVFDYKVDMPNVNTRTKATGFGSQKTLPGRDEAAVFVFLQRRWEDAKGNIHAKRDVYKRQTWSGAPERIIDDPSGSATVIESTTFAVDSTGKGGDMIIVSLISTTGQVQGSASIMQPLSVSAAAKAEILGKWQAVDDDEIHVSIDPVSYTHLVDWKTLTNMLLTSVRNVHSTMPLPNRKVMHSSSLSTT